MSKGLEALERIRKYCAVGNPFGDGIIERNKSLKVIEKELKALEIIKELVNSYDINELPDSWFELLRTWLNKVLSKEKLELLKEVLL